MKYDRHEDGSITREVDGETKTLAEFRDDGKKRCLAWLREQDRQCNSFAARDLDVCMSHGAAAVKLGPSNHNWKHGRYSRVVPRNLKEKYEESVTDPDILVQRDSIALCDARIGELLEQIEDSPAPAWKDARRVLDKVRTALRKQDSESMAEHLETLDEMIASATSVDRTWEKIFQAMKRRGDSVEQERRRLEAMKSYITAPQVVALATRMVDLAARYIDDRNKLAKFVDEVKVIGSIEGAIGVQ